MTNDRTKERIATGITLLLIPMLTGVSQALVAPTPPATTSLISRYDTNGDGSIQRLEAVAAVLDYFSAVITRQQAIEIVMSFFSGTAITPAATPVPSQPSKKINKFSLWANGTQLRGANIYQRIIFPDVYDDPDVWGNGTVGPVFTQYDFYALSAAGANLVVLSHPGLFEDRPPYVLNEGVQDNLDKFIAMAEKADLFAVIAFRTGPGRSEFRFFGDLTNDTFGQSHLNDEVWRDKNAQDKWVEMWKYAAIRYRNSSTVVGYELMVEPNSNGVWLDIYNPEDFYPAYENTTYDWNQMYPNISRAIRDADSETPILIGGLGWSQIRWLPYLKPTGDNRTVYTVHQYEPQEQYTHQDYRIDPPLNGYPGRLDTNGDGIVEGFDSNWLDVLLSPVDRFKSGYSAPVAVTEYGVQRWVHGGAQYLDDEMARFEERGMNYALWSWQPASRNFSAEQNDFNFRLGPEPDNITEGGSLIYDTTKRYWMNNSVKPSVFASAGIWKPQLNTSWQYQLQGTVNQSYNVDMYDIDMFDNNASIVESLHEKGRKVVCYINAGAWESWRHDASLFPDYVLGNNVTGWPNERWLDIRRIDIIGPIMERRMDLCKSKGFDGIEPDNINGYKNNLGFNLTYQDQLRYNIFLANEAHNRSLSIGLKNDMDQINDLLPYFDWALNEQCFQYQECDLLKPFITNNKPVFEVEYDLNTGDFCPEANNLNFNSIKKHLDLYDWREPCRGP